MRKLLVLGLLNVLAACGSSPESETGTFSGTLNLQSDSPVCADLQDSNTVSTADCCPAHFKALISVGYSDTNKFYALVDGKPTTLANEGWADQGILTYRYDLTSQTGGIFGNANAVSSIKLSQHNVSYTVKSKFFQITASYATTGPVYFCVYSGNLTKNIS